MGQRRRSSRSAWMLAIAIACVVCSCASQEREDDVAAAPGLPPLRSARGAQAQRDTAQAASDPVPIALPSASEPSKGATLSRIAIYGAPSGGDGAVAREVRVVLHFDGEVVYRRGELPAESGLPRRLVLDLDGVKVAEGVQRALSVGAGGLSRVRTFGLDDNQIRVSFDVGDSTAYRLFFLSDPFRIVMDFRDSTRLPRSAGGADQTIVVLDPGHGGEQPGAKGHNGLKEAHVALALSLRVRRALLRQRPDVRVVMTRSQDRFISLEERAAIANAVDADLFVSIHLNASHSSEDQGGVATFVLDNTNDQAALRLAAAENGTDIEGVSRLQLILASLVRKDQVVRSRQLAEDVQVATLHGGRKLIPDLHDRGVKSALFYVLVGAQMPAVLVEASFITHKQEAEALATEPYRQALADGIAEGLLRYIARPKPKQAAP